jgi:hypothetical protein
MGAGGEQTSATKSNINEGELMSSQAVRDPLKDELLTPQNAALIIIDYQPVQVNSIASMDRQLLVNNIVGVAKLGVAFRLPIIFRLLTLRPESTSLRFPNFAKFWETSLHTTARRSTHGRIRSSTKPSKPRSAKS